MKEDVNELQSGEIMSPYLVQAPSLRLLSILSLNMDVSAQARMGTSLVTMQRHY